MTLYILWPICQCQNVRGIYVKIDRNGMIRLLLVDDQSIVMQGLRRRLLLEPDISVVGEANSGEQAMESGCSSRFLAIPDASRSACKSAGLVNIINTSLRSLG